MCTRALSLSHPMYTSIILLAIAVMMAGCTRRSEPTSAQPSQAPSALRPVLASQGPQKPDAASAEVYDATARTHTVAPPRELQLPDAARGRDVVLTVRHPVAAEGQHFALVIFSHGAGGSGEAFASLSDALAARGCVVVHPWHSDSIALERREGGRGFDPARGLSQVVDRVDLADRLLDVQFVIDHVGELERQLDLLPGSIDPQRIALAGHSAGAMTAQAAAGLTYHALRRSGASRGISTPIEKIKAFALISPQGVNDRFITQDSWQACTRPMLTITGSADTSRVSDETPQSRRHPFEYAPADGTKYLAFIDGATHSSFQGPARTRLLREASPANIDWIESITTRAVIAMVDAYVNGLAPARAWLDRGDITTIPGGSLEWKHK
jgi:predicted dienelactone hydrolase